MALALDRNSKEGPVPGFLLLFMIRIVRLCEDISDLYGPALQKRTPDDTAATGLERG
jgi:hypothetical protein